MSDNDWLPTNTPRLPMGTFDGMGAAVQPHRSHNSLMSSDNAVVRNIGLWLYDCPPDLENSATAYMGVIHGIRFALDHPDIAREALRDMVTRARNKAVPVDDALARLDDVTNYWLNGD